MKAAPSPLSLKAQALRWLAQREHTRLELRRKLMAAASRRDRLAAAGAVASGAEADGAPDHDLPDPTAEVEAVLDWLVERRHLSEARFVESRVHAREQRFGQRRIVQELGRLGVSLDTASAERLRASELDRARAVWARKFGTEPAGDPAARARQMRFLAGRGFSTDVIRRVVRGTGDDD